jgi:malate dehydrogenase (oxaloacetate-decarboxylating)(NADP+)
MDDLRKRALDYHQFPKPGKLSVDSSKPCATQDDLSLAYTPGVAEPVRKLTLTLQMLTNIPIKAI